MRGYVHRIQNATTPNSCYVHSSSGLVLANRRLSGKLLATADHLLQLLQSGEFGLLTTEGMLQQPELPPLGDRGGRVVAV